MLHTSLLTLILQANPSGSDGCPGAASPHSHPHYRGLNCTSETSYSTNGFHVNFLLVYTVRFLCFVYLNIKLLHDMYAIYNRQLKNYQGVFREHNNNHKLISWLTLLDWSNKFSIVCSLFNISLS